MQSNFRGNGNIKGASKGSDKAVVVPDGFQVPCVCGLSGLPVAHLVPLVSGCTKATAKSVHEPFPVVCYFLEIFLLICTIFFSVLIEFVTILPLF